MSVLIAIGDHPRHRFLASRLHDAGVLDAVVVERRESHVPEPPDDLDEHLSALFRRHFDLRAEAEAEFFRDPPLPDLPTISVSRDELNSARVREFIADRNPEITITYGVHILSDETLAAVPGAAWNVHGGLSPEYRGVITHFWPSYMLEPQMTAVTLHELTGDVDAGAIVHQTGADLVRGDGVHQLASRTVRKFANELPRVVEIALDGDLAEPVQQSSTGKLWLSRDWRPEHLVPVYDTFDNAIVDHCLDGDLEGREPDLVRQFD